MGSAYAIAKMELARLEALPESRHVVPSALRNCISVIENEAAFDAAHTGYADGLHGTGIHPSESDPSKQRPDIAGSELLEPFIMDASGYVDTTGSSAWAKDKRRAGLQQLLASVAGGTGAPSVLVVPHGSDLISGDQRAASPRSAVAGTPKHEVQRLPVP